ncbi:UNC93-like protein 2 [Colletotrichum shisoi]|uniref:UNC93-like protein 2 n=1 Tax=Colletotrichum shisoi TaxID=2078593 RepID=A0A5Q4BH80_9PEZI|nr:UNC93-like protein 2 [Colletotrichum shisoi]
MSLPSHPADRHPEDSESTPVPSASSFNQGPSFVPKARSFFRSVPFQILVACGVSFTAPGMWDALGGLGAGGAAEPYAVSAANALAIIIGYPSPGDRAFYLAIWQTAKAAGPIVGGAINLGLNANRKTVGSVSSSTYIVFIVIMCLGLPIALCLSPARKVWRKDGTKIITPMESSWGGEFKAVGKLFASRRILLLLPAFFISYFYNGFMSTWLATYFTVRSRAFSSFFTNFAGIFSSFLIAALLDNQKVYIKTRGRIAFLSIVALLVGTWIWATILQKQIYDAAEPPVYDWFQGGFGKSYALVFFWQFGGQAFQQFLYWLVGQYATDLSDLSRHTGILRGTEALGQTVAWA